MIPCYTIRDPQGGQYFKTSRGKMVWNATNHAKNAWNEATNASRTGIKFDDNPRWIVEKSVVISEAFYNELFEFYMANAGKPA